MAFLLAALGRSSGNTNLSVSLNYNTDPVTPTRRGSFNIWTYNGLVAGDTLQQIFADNYFTTLQPVYNDTKNMLALNFQIGDTIFINDNADNFAMAKVIAVQYPSGTRLGIISIEQVPGGATPSGMNFISVVVDSAEFRNMATAPVLILTNPVVGASIIIEKAVSLSLFGTIGYVVTDDVILQYGDTANAGGQQAAADFIATAFQQNVDTLAQEPAGFGIGNTFAPLATVQDQDIYMSSATNPTTGDGNFIINVWYYVIPTA